MNKTINIKPLNLWQSILFFMVPGLYGLLASTFLMPYLQELGFGQEAAYNTVHLTVFLLLFLGTYLVLLKEGRLTSWSSIKERLRLNPMDSATWKLTLLFMFLYLLLGFLLNLLAQFVYEKIGFWPPDADIPLTNIPVLIILFVVNIFTEELFWRGIILPRQEVRYGKTAWVVNGILWSFFHIMKWWSVPFMLLKHWMIPLVSQRTKNTTPAILIHFISNGLGILISLIPLLTA